MFTKGFPKIFLQAVITLPFFINLLKPVVNGELFILFQRMLPQKAKNPVPKVIVFASDSINSEPDLRLYVCSFRLKIFHIKDGCSRNRHFYISIIRLCRLSKWALISPIFSRSSSKLEV